MLKSILNLNDVKVLDKQAQTTVLGGSGACCRHMDPSCRIVCQHH